LVHVDDTKYVTPLTVGAKPIADYCTRTIYCTYEEDLINPDVVSRWMELDTGQVAFHMLRDPISFMQYTGTWIHSRRIRCGQHI